VGRKPVDQRDKDAKTYLLEILLSCLGMLFPGKTVPGRPHLSTTVLGALDSEGEPNTNEGNLPQRLFRSRQRRSIIPLGTWHKTGAKLKSEMHLAG
jgi:hypothetical protein